MNEILTIDEKLILEELSNHSLWRYDPLYKGFITTDKILYSVKVKEFYKDVNLPNKTDKLIHISPKAKAIFEIMIQNIISKLN
jgi:hypothetical protein